MSIQELHGLKIEILERRLLREQDLLSKGADSPAAVEEAQLILIDAQLAAAEAGLETSTHFDNAKL